MNNFMKNSYLCNIVAKQTSGNEICGMAKEKNFLRQRDIFSRPKRKNEESRNRF